MICRLLHAITNFRLYLKRRVDRHGRTSGGTAYSRGALYNILRNPIYIGKVRHKGELYDGRQKAILDDDTWQRVQAQLKGHGGKRIDTPRRSAKRLLDGLLFDSTGRAMRLTYASKSSRQGGIIRTKRYWYYVSNISGAADRTSVERLPAMEIERLVLSSLRERLGDKTWLADQIDKNDVPMVDLLGAADAWRAADAAHKTDADVPCLQGLVTRIDVLQGRMDIHLNLQVLLGQDASCQPTVAAFEVPFQRRRNGRAKPIVIAPEDAPQPDTDLIALVADARRWAKELLAGEAASIRQIEKAEGLRGGSVSRVLPLAWLAPNISTAIHEGRQPPHLSAKSLRDLSELPLDWNDQRQILGFAAH